jgi:hypothetical protein
VTPEPTPEHIAAVRAWFVVWHSLIKAQQDAWRQLSKNDRDASKRMSAAEFAKFMAEIVKAAA